MDQWEAPYDDMAWTPRVAGHSEENFIRMCEYYDVPVVSARLAWQKEARRKEGPLFRAVACWACRQPAGAWRPP